MSNRTNPIHLITATTEVADDYADAARIVRRHYAADVWTAQARTVATAAAKAVAVRDGYPEAVASDLARMTVEILWTEAPISA